MARILSIELRHYPVKETPAHQLAHNPLWTICATSRVIGATLCGDLSPFSQPVQVTLPPFELAA